MNHELVQAAAVLTAELLRRPPTSMMDATPEVIASAFETAYLGIEQGLARVEKEKARGSQSTFAKLAG